LKKQKQIIKTKQECNKSWLIPNVNTCICCGAIIPEGMLACKECETGITVSRCVICDKPLGEGLSVCSRCQATVLRSKTRERNS